MGGFIYLCFIFGELPSSTSHNSLPFLMFKSYFIWLETKIGVGGEGGKELGLHNFFFGAFISVGNGESLLVLICIFALFFYFSGG